jgi:hypothetical protein
MTDSSLGMEITVVATGRGFIVSEVSPQRRTMPKTPGRVAVREVRHRLLGKVAAFTGSVAWR